MAAGILDAPCYAAMDGPDAASAVRLIGAKLLSAENRRFLAEHANQEIKVVPVRVARVLIVTWAQKRKGRKAA